MQLLQPQALRLPPIHCRYQMHRGALPQAPRYLQLGAGSTYMRAQLCRAGRPTCPAITCTETHESGSKKSPLALFAKAKESKVKLFRPCTSCLSWFLLENIKSSERYFHNFTFYRIITARHPTNFESPYVSMSPLSAPPREIHPERLHHATIFPTAG